MKQWFGWRQRREPAPIEVGPGERVLAWARGEAGEIVAGSADALYLQAGAAAPTRVPWEQIKAADWDRDSSVLRVTEMAHWGDCPPEHRFTLDHDRDLLELVRERITASLVVQRKTMLDKVRGVNVIARRPPAKRDPVVWFFEFDPGLDPHDAEVAEASQRALAAARDEVGL